MCHFKEEDKNIKVDFLAERLQTNFCKYLSSIELLNFNLFELCGGRLVVLEMKLGNISFRCYRLNNCVKNKKLGGEFECVGTIKN